MSRDGRARPFSPDLQRGDDVELDEIVIDGGAGAEFQSITDFVTECIERVGGAEAGGVAGEAFAFGDKAVTVGGYGDIESHSEF